jgi:hypothetical protein
VADSIEILNVEIVKVTLREGKIVSLMLMCMRHERRWK